MEQAVVVAGTDQLPCDGIDVGSREYDVAVSAERDPQPVRCFGTFTRSASVGRVAPAMWCRDGLTFLSAGLQPDQTLNFRYGETNASIRTAI